LRVRRASGTIGRNVTAFLEGWGADVAPRDFRLTPDWLTRYQLRTRSGALVSLATVASLSSSVQPNGLPTFQQLNSATLQGVPFPGHTLGEAIGFLQQKAKELLPEGYSVDYQGESRQFVQEGNTLIVTFVFALIVIFLVLAAQFESFRDPVIILLTVPLALFGALLALYVTGSTLNISSFMGAIMVVGIVHKNGILMLDAEKVYTGRHYPLREAVFQAGRRRLRPILMTALATVFGMLPLALGVGSGAQMLQPLAIAVIGGVSVSMILSLLITPVLFCWLREKGL
jgi:multidrug efflux pump